MTLGEFSQSSPFAPYIIVGVLLILVVLLAWAIKRKSQDTEENKPVVLAPVPAPVAAPQPQQTEMQEEELVAAITAAIASLLNTSTYQLKIRSIRRSDSQWPKAARGEQFRNNY